MKKRKQTSTKIYVAATMCVLVAVLGLTAGYYGGQKNERAQLEDDLEQYQEYTAQVEEDVQEQKEEQEKELENKQVAASDEKARQTQEQETSEMQESEEVSATEPENGTDGQTAVIEGSTEQTEETVAAMSENTAEINYSFSEESTLLWPVNGNVILDYNMEKMVYFETLDQYKYNPAILIDANVNDPVQAAADGSVIDISVNEETGKTVTVDIGNAYQLTYGQLKEVACEVGDVIKEGEIIGYINEPTKYYSAEGANLYFKMTNATNPVNPISFFGAE